MASPLALTELTQEAARQSLIEISQSVPEVGATLNVKSPNGAMAGVQDDGAEKYRTKLMSISDLSPDDQPLPLSPKADTA